MVLKTIDTPFDCAIKELTTPESDSTFYKEFNALACMREIDHKHLIKCIAAVQKERRYFFVFPWADGGNLREFWGSDDFASPDTKAIPWVISQLRGLAEGLAALHQYNTRHGDIKPENILRFSDPASPAYGRLVIADFGLAKVHTDTTRSRHFPTRTVTGTARYEAPEALSPDRSRSRLYDLWGMGCIVLEFLTWILHGREELRKFNASFESYATPSVTSPLHQVAQNWTEFMLRDPRCARNTALGEILDFNKKRLLVPMQSEGSSQSRASAKDLCDYLDEICTRGSREPAYIFDSELWKAREPQDLPFYHLSNDASLHLPVTNRRERELSAQKKLSRRFLSLPRCAKTTRDNDISGADLEKTPRKLVTIETGIAKAGGHDITLPKASVLSPAAETTKEEPFQTRQNGTENLDTETEVDNESIRSTAYEFTSSESSWSRTSSNGYDSISSLNEDVVEATSQENHWLESLVKHKKASLADKTMSWFSMKLDSGLTLMAYQQGETSTGGGAIQGSRKPTDDKRSENQVHRKRKGIRKDGRGHEDNSEDGGEDDDRKGKGKKKPRTSANQSRKLACPFFKHDSDLYGKNMTCRGHSWDTVHRIK
jgi:serine/threonine protein kinase